MTIIFKQNVQCAVLIVSMGFVLVKIHRLKQDLEELKEAVHRLKKDVEELKNPILLWEDEKWTGGIIRMPPREQNTNEASKPSPVSAPAKT